MPSPSTLHFCGLNLTKKEKVLKIRRGGGIIPGLKSDFCCQPSARSNFLQLSYKTLGRKRVWEREKGGRQWVCNGNAALLVDDAGALHGQTGLVLYQMDERPFVSGKKIL